MILRLFIVLSGRYHGRDGKRTTRFMHLAPTKLVYDALVSFVTVAGISVSSNLSSYAERSKR